MSAPVQPEHRAATRHCGACWYDLRGLPLEGKCPECGRAYDREEQAQELATAARDEARRPTDGQAFRDWWSNNGPAAWTVAVVLLVLASTGVLAGFGWYAYVKFEHRVNSPW